jgi:vacuolar-type H+-ATPase subunit H
MWHRKVVRVARLNFLDRFRPIGAPGAAGATGQTEEVRGLAAELAPVFAALAPDLDSARALVSDAERLAEKTVADAHVRASDITAQARLDAVTERTRAATTVEKESAGHDRRLMTRAHKAASNVETGAMAELDAAAQRVIERMVTDLLRSGDSSTIGETGS